MGERARLLVSPVFAASLALLVLNDRVLKAAWPGLVTGKLSDVAGVVMIAIAATAITGRVRWSLGATAVGFGLLKSVPPVAVAAAPVLGGVTRADPTDLIALVALWPLAHWISSTWSQRERERERERVTVAERLAWLLVPAKVLALCGAVLATTATSCGPSGVGTLARSGAVLFASTSEGTVSSADGGVTWIGVDFADTEGLWGLQGTECTPDGTCYRVDAAANRVVAVAPDATETVEVEFASAEVAAISEVADDGCGSGLFGPAAVVELDDGVHAVVSMGGAGVLHRPPDGRWEWIEVAGFGLPSSFDDEAAGLPIRSIGPGEGGADGAIDLAVTAIVLLVPLAVACATWPAAVMNRRRGRGIVAPILTTFLGTGVTVAVALGLIANRGFDGTWDGRLGAVAALVVVGVLWIAATLAVCARGPYPAPPLKWPPPPGS